MKLARTSTLAAMNSSSTVSSLIPATSRVGFLGPVGTFTEQALHSEADLAASELIPIDTIDEVLRAVDQGDVDYGFVAIENAIEGTVNITLDTLAFELDLRIQREVLLDVHMNLMAVPGTALADIAEILSIPVAVAQVRNFLREHLPNVVLRAANSTAEAAQIPGSGEAARSRRNCACSGCRSVRARDCGGRHRRSQG